MALVRRQRRARVLTVVAIALAAAIAHEGYRAQAAHRFNAALRAGEVPEPYRGSGADARFARAYALQQQGSFEEATGVYRQLTEAADPGLAAAVKYNVANLYLRHAMVAGGGEINDLAIPLIELAKQNYRELLRRNSQDWDSKYNLERALELLPELEEEEQSDMMMPEHSRRSLRKQEAHQELP